MPHRSAAVYHRNDHHAPSGKPRLQPARPPDRPARQRRADYTLLHAGRQLRLGPIAFWVVVGTLVDHGGLDPHHRHLFRLPRGRADAADRAPDRDAVRLRGPHRRAARAGRPHVEPPAARPGTIRAEARPDRAPPDRAGIARRRAEWVVRLRPHRDRSGSRSATRRRARRRSGLRRSRAPVSISRPSTMARDLPGARVGARDAKGGVDGALAGLQASLDRVEARQSVALQSVEQNYNAKVQRMHGVLTELGLDPQQNRSARHRRCHRRTVRRGAATRQRQRFRAPGLARQCRACPGRPADADARVRAAAQAGDGRDRLVVGLRRAHRSVRPRARHAYRIRFPRRHRRSGARHRERQSHERRLERRLRQDGRGRSRQRPRHPLRPPLRDRVPMSDRP